MGNQSPLSLVGVGQTFAFEAGCSAGASSISRSAIGRELTPDVMSIETMFQAEVIRAINNAGIRVPVKTIPKTQETMVTIEHKVFSPNALSLGLNSRISTPASGFLQPYITQVTFAAGQLTATVTLPLGLTLQAATAANTGLANQEGKVLTWAAVAAAGTFQATAAGQVVTITINVADQGVGSTPTTYDLYLTTVAAANSQSVIQVGGLNSRSYGDLALLGAFNVRDDCDSFIWFRIPRLGLVDAKVNLKDSQSTVVSRKYQALPPTDGSPVIEMWFQHSGVPTAWPIV